MTIESNFILECQKGNLIMASQLYSIAIKYNKNIDIKEAFCIGLKNGHLEIIKWLYSFNKKYEFHEISSYFIIVCKNGHLDIIKWLISLNIFFDTNDIINEGFDSACSNGKIDIAEFLYEKYKNINLNGAFITACSYNKLYVAIWLLSLNKKIDLHYESDNAFRSACSLGYLDIAKWLMSFDDKPDIHIDNDEVFRNACTDGYINIAKWLYSLDDKPNIRANNDDAFKNACSNQHIDIALWLTTICNDFNIVIKHNEIINWKIKNGLEEFYNKKEYDKIIKILNIQKKEYIENTNNQCSICYGNKPNFTTSCNHTFCLDCFLTWYICHDKKECSYCRQDIIINNCLIFL